jgi:hypothetical protein
MRLPRPTGIYVSKSPHEIVAPTLSPEFSLYSESIMPSFIPVLEYISTILQERSIRVTLLIGRGKPYPTGQPSDLMLIPVDSTQPQAWSILVRAIAKASRKFSLGQIWTDALSRSQHERKANGYLIEQSILQNEVVFSQEGLTVLTMDRIYTFKRRMCILSTRPFSRTDEEALSSCISLLHRIVTDFSNRPFSKAFFHRVYEQLAVPDVHLTIVAAAYKSVHKRDAIILPLQQKSQPEQPLPAKAVEPVPSPVHARTEKPRGQARRPSLQIVYCPRPPKTPMSPSDVTPTTSNEWNIFLRGVTPTQPKVTNWVPSPTVLAAA